MDYVEACGIVSYIRCQAMCAESLVKTIEDSVGQRYILIKGVLFYLYIFFLGWSSVACGWIDQCVNDSLCCRSRSYVWSQVEVGSMCGLGSDGIAALLAARSLVRCYSSSPPVSPYGQSSQKLYNWPKILSPPHYRNGVHHTVEICCGELRDVSENI